MNIKIKYTFLLALFLVAAGNVFSAKRYWLNNAAANWNTTANWSATSGGGGGSSVPGSSDTAYFDGSGLGRCDIDANVNVKRFEIKSGYTDTITQNAYTITIGNSGMILADGVFIGSSSSITINGNYNNSGCNFTSTSGTMDVQAGDFKLTGTGSFANNSGSVKLSLSGSVTDTCHLDFSTSSSTKTFYNLEIGASSSTTNHVFKFGTGNTLTVDHTLTVSGSGTKSVGTGTIEANGDVTVSGTGFFGSFTGGVVGTLKFTGSSTQTLTGSGSITQPSAIKVEIAKSSDTLKLSGTIAIKYDWKLTSGNLDAGTSKLYIMEGVTNSFTGNFSGHNALNKLVFSASTQSTITINDTLQVNDSIIVANASTWITKGTNAGILAAKGTVYLKSTGFFNWNGTGTLLMNGSGTQKLRSDCSSSATTSNVAHFVIKKPASDTLVLSGNIKIGRNWTYTSGIINSDNAAIYFFNHNEVITGSHTLKKVHFDYSVAGTASNITIASGTELTVSDSLWFDGDEYGSLNTGVINAKGAIILDNTSTTGSYSGASVGTGIIKINGTGDQTITGTSSATTMHLPSMEINKSSGTLYLTNFIHIGRDWTYTSGTVNSGTSTVCFSRTNTIAGSHTLYNIKFPGLIGSTTSAIGSGTTLTCTGTLSYEGSTAVTVNTGTIAVQGGITNSNTNTGGGGSATILINGTGTQNFSGNSTAGAGPLPIVTINKSSGTLNLSNKISVKGNWTYTAGTINAGTSTVVFTASNTITGSHTLKNVTFPGTVAATVTIASGTTLTVDSTLSITGTAAATFTTGTIEAKGDITVSNTSTVTTAGGTATFSVTGTGTQTITGSGTAGTGFLPKISINKSSGTLYLSSIISVNQDWSYTGGTVDATTNSSTVFFRGAFNLDGQGTSTTMTFNKVVIGGSTTRTLTGNLTTSSDLTINASSTLNSGGYALTVGGAWDNQGTWTPGGSAFTLNGSGTQNLGKAGAALETFTNITVNKSGGKILLACPVKITTAMTLTKGKIISTTSNYLEFDNGASYAGGGDTAYVHGVIRKTGVDAFTFPLGDTTLSSGSYHPLSITAPSSATDQFEAAYKASGQTNGSGLAATLYSVSNCEYWTLKRNVGSTNVRPSINWNSNPCTPASYDNICLAAWDGTISKWTDQGDTSLTLDGVRGCISATAAITLGYSPLTLTLAQRIPAPTIAGHVTHAATGSANNGAILLTITGGTSPYTYAWSGPSFSATTKDIYNLATGAYTVTVTDANSLVSKKYFIVGRLNASVSVSLQPDSYGGKDAQVFKNDNGTGTTHGARYPNATTMQAIEWSNGTWYKGRSFIQYDLSSLPANAVVSSSTLTLYGTAHDPASRSNASYFRRLSGSWNENSLTWDNQPSNTSTGQISLAASTGSTDNYTLNVATHVQDMITTPTGNYGWVLMLQDETTQSNTKMVFGSSDNATSGSRPKLDITFTITAPADADRNYTLTQTYNESGTVIAASKEYSDALGRGTQTLAQNSAGTVFAVQTVYDAYGRPGISTLAAPVGSTLVYQDNFLLDATGSAYTYTNFDVSAKLNNPDGVLQGINNTLGTYYSDNSSETYIATSQYPFARKEYTADPTSTAKRSAGAGEAFKMGSGHETVSFSMVSGDELRTLFGSNKGYKASMSSTDKMSNSAISLGSNIQVTKTVGYSPDGKIVITYNAGDKAVASCMSALGSPEACTMSSNSIKMLYNGTQSVDIHVPAACTSAVKFPLPTYICSGGSTCTVTASDITYKVTDLNTNTVLVLNTDYSINSSTRFVTFSGSYASGSHVYRISFVYSSTFISSMNTSGYTIPDHEVQYDLDYGQWSVNFYDLAGRLRKTVTPLGIVSCSTSSSTMFTTYDYSTLGQVVAKKSADEGLVEMVYDKEGRLRFTQDAEQANNDRFSYVNYDVHGRSTENGEYTTQNNGATSLFFNNYYAAYTAPNTGNVSNATVIDNVDGINDAQCTDTYITDYNPLASGDEIPSGYTYKSTYSGFTKAGQVSRTRNDNTITWYAYDNNNRLFATVKQILDADWTTQNTTADAQIFTMDFTYDAYTGLVSHQYFQKNDTAKTLEHKYTYNGDNKLTQIDIKRGNHSNGYETQAVYAYYNNGRLKRTELGASLQGLDYVYTLNGVLKAMNHPSLDETKDPGLDGHSSGSHTGFSKDIFGFALEYYTNDYTRTSSNYNTNATSGGYNGMIYGVRYKTRNSTNSVVNGADYIDYGGGNQLRVTNGTTDEVLNQYTYDKFNRLATSVFSEWNNSTNTITTFSLSPYKEFGSSSGGIAYDANGNITNLQRNAYNGCDATMDNLAYTYASGTNKLSSITDNAGATSCITTDFEASSSAFGYDLNGQLYSSAAENVSTITYYPNHKTKKVTFNTTSNTTEYFYDDAGQKYKVRYYDAVHNFTVNTWYINGAVYDQNTVVNNSINLKELTIGSRIATLMNTGANLAMGEIDYELTDHLGNVRATFKNAGGVAQVTMWKDYYVFGGFEPGRQYQLTAYRYSHQGQEKQSIDGSNWGMFELRMFNSDLGKWLSPDPAGQYNSPYIGMGNNPVNGTDPDGAYFVGGLGRGAMIAIATNKMNENIAANAKASYWESRKKFMGRHGEADINVDVEYVAEIGQEDALNMTSFGIGGLSWEFPTAPNNGDIYDQGDKAFEGSLNSYTAEKEAEMMSWSTTVDVTASFNGISRVIAHAEFDEGADADAFAHAQAERYSANTGYMWNEVKADREKIAYAGMVGNAQSLLEGAPLKKDNGATSDMGTEDSENSKAGTNTRLSSLSFQFQKTTSDAHWQSAGVKGFVFSVFIAGEPIPISSQIFEIEVGVPTKLVDGTVITAKYARKHAADAANNAASIIMDEFTENYMNIGWINQIPKRFAGLTQYYLGIPGSRVTSPILTPGLIATPAIWINNWEIWNEGW